MKKAIEPQTKCNLPKNVKSRDWPKCDNCWVAWCGYSRLTRPNPNWKKQYGICKFEHCIEMQSIYVKPPRPRKSCPIFGHDCPGGAVQTAKCKKLLPTIPQKRFAKPETKPEVINKFDPTTGRWRWTGKVPKVTSD